MSPLRDTGAADAGQLAAAARQALRPFSFTIAVISTLLGIALAWHDGHADPLNALLTVVAGVLMQAGVNLVNDLFEFKRGTSDNKFAALSIFGESRSRVEWVIYWAAMGCFFVASLIGLVLVARTGTTLLWIGIVGVLSAYFYTGEPFDYKRRGLAVALVFIFMGALMVEGAYFATAGRLSLDAALVSIPASLLVSLLLLSNELRDYEDHTRHGIGTLTVRIGYERGVALYVAIVAAAYGSALLLALAGMVPAPALLLLSIPAARAPMRFLRAAREQRGPITPLTARLHLVFGVLFIATVVLGKITRCSYTALSCRQRA